MNKRSLLQYFVILRKYIPAKNKVSMPQRRRGKSAGAFVVYVTLSFPANNLRILLRIIPNPLTPPVLGNKASGLIQLLLTITLIVYNEKYIINNIFFIACIFYRFYAAVLPEAITGR